eukprot:TRINITY_DN2676_c0_g2_i6.p1 TRINITY_DN2676_c0_g2~~TRINITY_DN2676_c0_g2_i6.p1  ORF type:complete len:339 (-),score=54.18 TRINITY_DN2676_c0_g2_i6:78-1094(-)
MAKWIQDEHKVEPIIEPAVQKETFPQYRSYKSTDLPLPYHIVDFIICIGGDGTLLHANSLFKRRIPPVVAFYHGTLGFLTPFKVENFKIVLSDVILGNVSIMLRSRLLCSIHRSDGKKKLAVNHSNRCCGGLNDVADTPIFPEDDHFSPDCGEDDGILDDPESHLHALSDPENLLGYSMDSSRPGFYVLNEVVVDRGQSPYVTSLQTYCNGHLITNVKADGLILSTATGSTAYSLAAGGAMIHPEVPAILYTPICPHSLSFRPVVFPDHAKLRVQVSEASRASAWVSFDGRFRTELSSLDSVIVRTSKWPLPFVTTGSPVQWIHNLATNLHWNNHTKL